MSTPADSGSATLCVLPWVHVEVMPQGVAKLCCVARGTVHEKNVPLNVTRQSLDEIRRSVYMRSARQALASGRRIPACESCWAEERRGEPSQRQIWNARHADTLARLRTEVARGRDPAEPLALEYLQLSLGNKCNLACRMCNADYSSRIADDRVHVKWAPGAPPARPPAGLRAGWEPGRPWFEQPLFLHEDLLPAGDSLKLLTVTGGEPLLSENFREHLDELVRRERAAGIVVRLSSNLFHNEARIHQLMERLSRFRHCSVGASVDGVGAVYEYIRHPARWDIVARNLRIVRDYAQRTHSVTCTLDAVVQPYNCLNLSELLDFADQVGVECYLHPLEEPAFLRLSVVPHALRLQAAERLRAYAQAGGGASEVRDRNRETALRVAAYFEQIEDAPGTPEARRQFAAFTLELDGSRKQDLAACVPELAAALASELAAVRRNPGAHVPRPWTRRPWWVRLARLVRRVLTGQR